MYLGGLKGIAYGISQKSCSAMGGQWQNANPNVPTFNPVGNCYYPDPVAAPPPAQQAPVTVYVPTNVNTQVSPQISPNLIQQQQPTNSPVGASTAQTAAPQVVTPTPVIVAPAPTSPASTAGDDMQALLDAIAASQAATVPSTYSPSYSGGSDAVFAPSPVAPVVAVDYTKYIPYALLAAGALFFVMNNHDKQKRA